MPRWLRGRAARRGYSSVAMFATAAAPTGSHREDLFGELVETVENLYEEMRADLKPPVRTSVLGSRHRVAVMDGRPAIRFFHQLDCGSARVVGQPQLTQLS